MSLKTVLTQLVSDVVKSSLSVSVCVAHESGKSSSDMFSSHKVLIIVIDTSMSWLRIA